MTKTRSLGMCRVCGERPAYVGESKVGPSFPCRACYDTARRHRVQEGGTVATTRKRSPETAARVARTATLLAEGLTQSEIARLLGVTPAAVAYYMRRLDEDDRAREAGELSE